ncbi:1,4-alpha-glucan branching protein GlgB [Halomonas salinarum]|uniref:1,4-alpha-glucan branching protein GlgB n=1 Tax=Halomonas salinarum TaxID=1158993 RepID=UPI001438923C|nr:1,4-alpha-glucan branching protein GlgB [Halomonas salinarum]
MELTVQATIDASQIDSIESGEFSDIFSVLGLQQNPVGNGLVVRALLPGAQEAAVVDRRNGRTITRMVPIGANGLFEAVMPRRKNRFDYRLKVRYADAEVVQEDPYRFPSMLNDDDLYLFGEGTQERTYRWMGAHPRSVDGIDGVLFVVWAPAASRVSVVGDFNLWDGRRHIMRKHPASGVWEVFIPGVEPQALYKYEILDAQGNLLPLKSDPYALSMQHPPETASRVIGESEFAWSDKTWMMQRAARQGSDQPISIYEVHAGSWRRRAEDGNRYLSYRELADELIPYVLEMGFTHIQLMPISEYPFDGSWGYQPIGLYAPSIRFGAPDDLRYFVDCCHRNEIGVMIDWVPGHFPADVHGLARFDGTALYEHEDLRQGFHPDWNTLIYNYGRNEVLSFLLSNALFWLDQFHIDGLRVDAVASMLYLDYSREDGEWIPNRDGGRENLEAIEFLKRVNASVARHYPGALMIAEESTSWPGVTAPVEQGGLGFDFKWNMGWMNDSLVYMGRDPLYRQYHHDQVTFGLVYAFSERFVLPLSHDEVVHGKGSLLARMPGDEWQQFANLRAYLGLMWGHPGKKLLFMGGELAQRGEWNHNQSLDWYLLEYPGHAGVKALVQDLNRVYRDVPALYRSDCDSEGFEWVQGDNSRQSVFAWLRRSEDGRSLALVVSNMTPEVHYNYRVGVPVEGEYVERINSDSALYGGSNVGNHGGVEAEPEACNGRPFSVALTLPPLATLVLELGGV